MFKDNTSEHIELNLDDIFNENGYINKKDVDNYQENKNVKSIKLIRTKNTPIKIGNSFLCRCSKLTTIDLSALQHVTKIGDCFLYNCSKLTTIDLLPLSNVTQIGNSFLSGCSILTTIDLSPLQHVTQIDNWFLSRCSNLTTIDLSPLQHVTQIGDWFVYYCSNLTTIICDNDIIIQKIKNMYQNKEIKSKSDYLFSTYDKDIEKIKLDKQHVKKVLDWLNIHYTKKNSHNVLIKKIEKERKKHNERMTEEELDECINTEEIFSMESLDNIPKSRLIKVNKINDKYYCFDVIALRNFIFQKQNDKYKNPYTNTEFIHDDIDKILKVNIGKIKYFC